MKELLKKKYKVLVIMLQIFFLLLLFLQYLKPKNNFLLTAPQIKSDEIYLENFLETGLDGYYIDSSSDEKLNFARTGEIELKPGVYEITIIYQSEGGPQKYLLNAENADFRLWQGNYHNELPSGRNQYTTLIWNIRELHRFEVECDYSGDGYILFAGARITEKKGWILALVLISVLLFGMGDFLLFRYGNLYKKLNAEKNRMIVFGCLFIIAFASLPLLSGLLYYGHDLEFHLLRIEGIKDGLLDHQFPVKVQPNWMNGYGYGVSIFYGDLLLYFPAILRLAGVGVQGAYKTYVLFINILTCLVSFYSFNKFAKDYRLGLIGSFLYTTSIYRLNCIYVRAAVGEYTAMLFMPLYFYGVYELLFGTEKGKRAWMDISIGFAGIVYSHMITSELIAFFTVLAGVFYYKKLKNKEIWISIGKCAVTILFCTAGFLVPFLDMSRDSYVFNLKGGEVSAIQTYGTTFSQIFNPFPSGKGEALAYTVVERAGIADGFAYAIGSGFSAAALLFIYYCAVSDRYRTLPKKRECKHLLIWGSLLVFMTTIWFPWNFIQERLGGLGFIVYNIQFPWRILGLASTVLVFFSCMLIRIFGKDGKQKKYICSFILLFAVLSSGYFLSDRMN